MKIILHSDDINLSEYWESAFEEDVSCIDEFLDLQKITSSLIIINYSVFNNSQASSIQDFIANANAVLVLHRTPNIKIAKEVLKYGASGYGNALMKEHFLLSAVAAIRENLVWLHPELTSQLISQISPLENKDRASLLSELSVREKELANLLKDGATYKTVALKLGITPRTVKAHANNIYKKLQVKDRLSLALLLK